MRLFGGIFLAVFLVSAISCSSNNEAVSSPESSPKASTAVSSGSILATELSASCSIDSQGGISCQAHRTSMKSKLLWRYMDKDMGGATFEFSPYEPIPSEIVVTLEECVGSTCSEVEITVDTSHLAIETSEDSSVSRNSSESNLYPELEAICSVNDEWKVSCEAHKTSDESTISWAYEDMTSGASTFEFSIYEPIMRGPVVLMECVGDTCEEVETLVDVSHLDPDKIARNWTMQSTYSQGNCDPDGVNTLESPPMDVSAIKYIMPMGHMQGDHVTPIDHMYVFFLQDKAYDVYAMADGHIVTIEDHGVDNRIVIEHSCDLYSIYIHIAELSKDIDSQLEWKFPTENTKGRTISRVPVKKGQVVGRVSGRDAFDISIVDTRVTLDGFVNLSSYSGEFWKFHTVDPFDYWNGSFRQELSDKTLSINEDFPGGKIDLDVDGKLVGNWFQEGTGGYSGLRTDDDVHGVKGHLAFAYSILVPDTLWISFGSFSNSGRGQSFGVKGNSPDPVDVGVESGLVKFELMDLDHGQGPLIETGYKITSTGEWWDGTTYPENGSLEAVFRDETTGVLLVEMLEDRRIKIEVFDNEGLDGVSEFTDNAKVYVR